MGSGARASKQNSMHFMHTKLVKYLLCVNTSIFRHLHTALFNATLLNSVSDVLIVKPLVNYSKMFGHSILFLFEIVPHSLFHFVSMLTACYFIYLFCVFTNVFLMFRSANANTIHPYGPFLKGDAISPSHSIRFVVRDACGTVYIKIV